MHSTLTALLLQLASLAAGAAGFVEVSAPTTVYDRSDPAFCRNCSDYTLVEVTDAARLAALDGVGPPDAFAEYLADGDEAEAALAPVVTGGYLKLVHSETDGRLSATVSYQAGRELTAPELAVLAEYTRGQLLDGIGEGFTQSGTHEQKVWVEFDAMNRRDVKVVQGSR